MKDIQLNPLDKNQRKLLQYGVILILAVFLFCFYFLSKQVKNKTVYLEDSKVAIFDESFTFAYPDKLEIHYPYLILVKPEKLSTRIYNLQTMKLEKETSESALDYHNDKLLYVKGASTFLDNQDLGVLCEKGVIKSPQEILCVVKINPNGMENKLISIQIKTKLKKDVYISKSIITALNFIDNSYYLGELDVYGRKSYLVQDGIQTEVKNVVSMIYKMQDRLYFASFKSAVNKQKDSYYEVVNNNTVEQKDSKVILYK